MQSENGTGKAAAPSRDSAVLRRLVRDTRGNTLAILGAAMMPLAAMIGSGVDMSRAYMAKNRLQSACDSAALAARRVMNNDQLTEPVRAEAVRFFNFNFPQELYDTEGFTPVVTRPVSGTVRVTAATRIPTAIMQIFGYESLPLSVTCDASLNFVNTDVMLVLDVTGSMAQNLGGTQKIAALRDAVMALYDELRPVQTQLEAAGLRLRYGVVPYSSTVNVGDLLVEADPDFVSDNVEYRTRVATYNTLTFIGETQPPDPPVVQQYPSSISQSNCDKYGRNVSFNGFNPSAASGGGPQPQPTWSRTFSNNEATGVDWGWAGSDTSGNTRSCRRRYVQTNTTYETRYRWTSSSYEPENIDVSGYKMGNELRVASLGSTISNDGNTANDGTVAQAGIYDGFELAAAAENVATTPLTWNGCIEERHTVNNIRYTSGYVIPDNAMDLQINMVPDPDDPDTIWRPMIPELYWRHNGGSDYDNMAGAACPASARRLQAWDRGSMLSFVNGLQPTGNTYHDIGMVWGARLLSSGGIFGDSPDNFNSMPVARHIIFMTDGQLEPSTSVYGAYGVETNDRRVTGSSTGSNQYESHLQRFRMICNQARGMNMSIWVIAFGTTLSSDMQSCASNNNQASTSSNRDQLIQRFREIGNNIGALRLTQ